MGVKLCFPLCLQFQNDDLMTYYIFYAFACIFSFFLICSSIFTILLNIFEIRFNGTMLNASTNRSYM
jgi:hypothetical protein